MGKRNNNSKFFKDWTTPKLKKEFLYYKDLDVNNPEAMGYKDYEALQGLENELEDRDIGYYSKIVFCN